MADLSTARRTRGCSFCGKRQEQVQRLIAGPSMVFICDECIRLCNTIIQENEGQGPIASGQSMHQPRWARFLGRAFGWGADRRSVSSAY